MKSYMHFKQLLNDKQLFKCIILRVNSRGLINMDKGIFEKAKANAAFMSSHPQSKC